MQFLGRVPGPHGASAQHTQGTLSSLWKVPADSAALAFRGGSPKRCNRRIRLVFPGEGKTPRLSTLSSPYGAVPG